jgi:hypothetical protein
MKFYKRLSAIQTFPPKKSNNPRDLIELSLFEEVMPLHFRLTGFQP